MDIPEMLRNKKSIFKIFKYYLIYLLLATCFVFLFCGRDLKIKRFLNKYNIDMVDYFYTFPRDSAYDENLIYKIRIKDVNKFEKLTSSYDIINLIYELNEDVEEEKYIKNILKGDIYYLPDILNRNDPITKDKSAKHYVIFNPKYEEGFYIRVYKI